MLRIATICRQKRFAPCLDGCCCCADVFVQYCHIDIFHCCLEVINGCGLDSSNLEFDPSPQEKVGGCNQGNAEAKRPPTVTKLLLLLWVSTRWFRSNEQLRHLVARHWLDWWQMNCFQPYQLMTILSKVSMTSMLTCPLHPLSISPPFPFHPWAKQTHVITALFPSQTCLLVYTILYYGTQETSYFEFWGWVKGIPSLITFKKQRNAFLPADGCNSEHFLTSM